MDDKITLCCVSIISVAICYVTYVIITHADGIVFGSFIGLITLIIGYAFGKVRGGETACQGDDRKVAEPTQV